MNMKNKNIVIAAAIAIAVLIVIVAGALALGGDSGASSSESSDIISSDYFQDAESGDTVSTADKSLTVSTTEAIMTTAATTAAEQTAPVEVTTSASAEDSYTQYYFRSSKLLNQHFEKHGGEFADDFGYTTAEEYEKGASDVINNPDSLYKVEAEDGDGVYYLEATNEFVILSTDGYIRTYFRPNGGIRYFNRQ